MRLTRAAAAALLLVGSSCGCAAFRAPGAPPLLRARLRAVTRCRAAFFSFRCCADGATASVPIAPGGALRLLQIGDLAGMLSACASSCGAVSRVRLGTRDVYFVAKPTLVKEICVEQAAAFPDREALAAEDLAAGCPLPLGLTLGQYDAWNRSRSILNPSFFRRDELAQHANVLVAKTERLVAHWEEHGAGSGSIVDLEQDATALSQSVLLHILFSLDERLWEQTPPMSLAPAPLPTRALEEVLAWKSLLQEQLPAIMTADRSFFRFVKVHTRASSLA
jgi:cytochrome P450